MFTRIALLALLALGTWRSLLLSAERFQTDAGCPSLASIPACYVALSGYLLMVVGGRDTLNNSREPRCSPNRLQLGAVPKVVVALRRRGLQRRCGRFGPQPSGTGLKRPPAASDPSPRAQTMTFGAFLTGDLFSLRRGHVSCSVCPRGHHFGVGSAKWLFWIGLAIVGGLALVGSGLELVNGDVCPKAWAWLPMCYASLAMSAAIGWLYLRLQNATR